MFGQANNCQNTCCGAHDSLILNAVVHRESISATWGRKRGVAAPPIALSVGNEHTCDHCPVTSRPELATRISLTAILRLDYLGRNLFHRIRIKACIAWKALAEERMT
jgi:hypothetical protein